MPTSVSADLLPVILFITVCITAADIFGADSLLTLQQAVDMGIRNSLQARRLQEEKNSIDQKLLRLKRQRIRHMLSFNLSNAYNEIGDPRDLEATASNTRQYSGTYKQIFLNGISLSLSHKNRVAEALDTSNSIERFLKYQAVLDLPLFGKSTFYTIYSSHIEQTNLSIEALTLEQKQRRFISDIIFSYLDLMLYAQEFSTAQLQTQLIEEKHTIRQATNSQLTGLERQRLSTELRQVKQIRSLSKSRFDNTRKKVALIIGSNDTNLHPPLSLDTLPVLSFTRKELIENYRNNSVDLLIARARIRIMKKKVSIARLDLRPDMAIGGFAGRSQSGSTGNNLGGYFRLNYNLFSGESQALKAAKSELNEYVLSESEIGQSVRIQAEIDFDELLASFENVEIHKELQSIARTDATLAGEQYRLGECSMDELIMKKMNAEKAATALLKSQIEYIRNQRKIIEFIQ